MTPELGLILGIIVVIAGIGFWLYKAGAKGFKAKILEQEEKDREKAEQDGEEWDGRGGLGGIVVRRVQRKKRSLLQKLGLGK
jgi:hypothetical protein